MILSTRICTASLYNRDLLSDQPRKSDRKLSVFSQPLKQFFFISLYTTSLLYWQCNTTLYCITVQCISVYLDYIYISISLYMSFLCLSCLDSASPVFLICFYSSVTLLSLSCAQHFSTLITSEFCCIFSKFFCSPNSLSAF